MGRGKKKVMENMPSLFQQQLCTVIFPSGFIFWCYELKLIPT